MDTHEIQLAKKLLILHYLWKETLDYTAIGTGRTKGELKGREGGLTCFTISQWVEILFVVVFLSIFVKKILLSQFEYFMNKL